MAIHLARRAERPPRSQGDERVSGGLDAGPDSRSSGDPRLGRRLAGDLGDEIRERGHTVGAPLPGRALQPGIRATHGDSGCRVASDGCRVRDGPPLVEYANAVGRRNRFDGGRW
ncbi:hypothetical protein ABZV67_19560 [Streptomyces sp. NPDC005065]|uniref:hypothetical protein n=1 Tax=Streptomyces sp. NPDC005065 TaxID=3154461 RepID=UPI0033A2A245